MIGRVIFIESINKFSFLVSEDSRQMVFENCYVVSPDPSGRQFHVLSQIESLDEISTPDVEGTQIKANCRILGNYDSSGKQKPLTRPIAYGSSVSLANPQFLRNLFHSPPPSISLGKPLGNPDVPLSVALDDFQRTATLITGTTGSGKTKAVSLILNQFIQQNGACVVFDFNKEYSALVPEEKINLMTPGETFFIGMDDQFIEVFSKELTDHEVDQLYHIYSLYGPDLSSMFRAFESVTVDKMRVRAYKSLERKLRTLSSRRLLATKEKPYEPIVRENKCTIVDLSELELKYQPLFINYLLKLIHSQRKKDIIPATFVIIEEADRFLNTREVPISIIKEIVLQGPKIKINVCLITQRPRFCDEIVLSNCRLQIFHTTRNPLDIETLSRVSQYLDSYYISKIPYLTKGQALISGPNVVFPIFVNIVSEF